LEEDLWGSNEKDKKDRDKKGPEEGPRKSQKEVEEETLLFVSC